jgi:hypothetical protein
LSQISIGGDDAGPGSDASFDVTADTAVPPDSGAGDSGASDTGSDSMNMDTFVLCGNMKCPTPAQGCCRTDGGNSSVNTCLSQNQSQCGGLFIRCDDSTDCPQGDVCCAHYNGFNIADKIECKAASTCNAQNTSTIVCDPNDPKSCPNGGMCTFSTITLPGYFICK